MYFPYHPTQLHYDPLQANRQIPPPTGYSKPNVQPFSSLDQPRLHAQPQSSYGHTLPPYVNSRHLSAMNQPPNPPNPPYVDVNSDFAKVWAACVDSYASSESRGMQQPINQHPLQHPTTLIQQYYALEPSADIHAKVSRWSQAIPHPPLPVPQQCLRAFEHPPRPDPPRRVHPAKTSSVSHQESVPRSAPQPVPEPNPLHRNEMLESPVALLQVPPKRGRNWPMPSTRVQVPTRSAQLLSQVTSPPHAPRAAAPVVSTMKRGHDDSPMVQPSPEDELDTPPDDAICLLLKQQVKRLPGSTDWIDDSPPHICGNNQSKPCQTPPYAIHDRGARTPFDDTHKEVAANALVKMYQRSKTDYSQPSQAMLAITLINAIPSDDDPIYMLSPLVNNHPIRVIDNLIMRFATGIHQSAVTHQADGKPIPIGSHQMLWELRFVSMKRWGIDSLLAEHTKALAESLEESP